MRVQAARDRAFAGRVGELALFRAALAGDMRAFTVMFLHGPGGIGKSMLLRRFAEEARSAGRTVVEVDGRTTQATPAAFEQEARAALTDERAVLLVDTFERCQGLEGWLRDRFLPRLPAGAIVVIAGRLTPDPRWTTDPGWSDLLHVTALRNLSPDESMAFLDARGVPGPAHAPLLAFTGGHPLALALAAAVGVKDERAAARWEPSREVIETLLPELVGEVPSPRHRRALEVCAHAYMTSESLLRVMLGEEEAGPLFHWLRSLPFIESSPQGLFPHDVVREALEADLRWRDREGFEELHLRLHRHLYEQARAVPEGSLLPAVGALLYMYRGDGHMSEFHSWRAEGEVYEEPCGPEDHGRVLQLTVEAEGEASAAIVRFWLGEQPGAFRIYRSTHTGETVAFAAWLRLEEPVGTDADPVVAAAWAHARATAPPRDGEYLGIARFSVYPPAYQRPSAPMDLIQWHTMGDIFRAECLAWSYIVMRDADLWGPHLRHFDMPPVAEAPYVGDFTYTLFAHDWRAQPPGPWLDLKTRVMLDGPHATVAPAELVVLSRQEFDAAARDEQTRGARRQSAGAQQTRRRVRHVAARRPRPGGRRAARGTGRREVPPGGGGHVPGRGSHAGGGRRAARAAVQYLSQASDRWHRPAVRRALATGAVRSAALRKVSSEPDWEPATFRADRSHREDRNRGGRTVRTVVIGAGVVGLTTALLLARDGHQVAVVDRDTGMPADTDAWERPGVTQFRHPHIMMPRACQLLATELPLVLAELMTRGGRAHNMLAGAWNLPTVGGRRPDDERFDTIAARRPLVEAALTAVALRTPGLTIHRNTPVTALLTGTDRTLGRPHIAGVLTRHGGALDADLVVDAAGRNSPVSKMLTDVGAARPVDDHADIGFRLYTRYFRSTDGTLPTQAAWPLDHHDSVSTITVPGDSDTWALSLAVSGRDQLLRALRRESAWQRAVALYPNVAHWATTGEPITGVLAMSGTESRIRRFVRDGQPVATGLVSVGDAWAATNPQFGLGMAMGMVHAAILRDLVRTTGPGEPEKLALAFDEATHATLAPIHQGLAAWDRHRLAQIDGEISGIPYEPEDPDWNFRQFLEAAKLRDPEILRAMGEVASMLATPDEALAPPGLPERVVRLGTGAPRHPEPGPSRAELLEAIASWPIAAGSTVRGAGEHRIGLFCEQSSAIAFRQPTTHHWEGITHVHNRRRPPRQRADSRRVRRRRSGGRCLPCPGGR